MSRRRIEIIMILLSVWLLAAILPKVHFAAGNWSLIDSEVDGRHLHPKMEMLLAVSGIALIGSTVMAAVLILRGIMVRIRQKKPEDEYFHYIENPPVRWPVYAVFILLIAGIGSIFYLSLRYAGTFEKLFFPQHSIQSFEKKDQKPLVPKIPSPEIKKSEPRTLPFTIPYTKLKKLLLLIVLIFSGLGLRHLFKHRPRKEEPEPMPIPKAPAEFMEELKGVVEPSDVVQRCYLRMCRILGRKVVDGGHLTAREFAALLRRMGIDDPGVARLTALFEQVRYGRYITDSEEQVEALALLKIIEEKYKESPDEA